MQIENVTLGRIEGFSDKDIQKINIMYKERCEIRDKKEKEEKEIDFSVEDIVSSIWPFFN